MADGIALRFSEDELDGIYHALRSRIDERAKGGYQTYTLSSTLARVSDALVVLSERRQASAA